MHLQKLPKHTPLYENEEKEREILQWRLPMWADAKSTPC